jgi:hypothetical protein
MLLDALGSYFPNQQWVKIVLQGNQAYVCCIALIAGTSVSKFG